MKKIFALCFYSVFVLFLIGGCAMQNTDIYVTDTTKVPSAEDQSEFNTKPNYDALEMFTPLGINPFEYNRVLALEKGLANEDGDFLPKYFEIQALFRASFETYLLQNINLDKAVEKLISNGIEDITILPTNKSGDYYVDYSNISTPYFCLRNNIYVEKLEVKDIQMLSNSIENHGLVATTETVALAKEKWKTVLDIEENSNKTFITASGIDKSCIVIESLLVYSEDDEKEDIVNDFDNYMFDEFTPWFDKEYENVLGVPMKLFYISY